jgi:hypothetical protein
MSNKFYYYTKILKLNPMKTSKINLKDLRNEEHFQFQTEFKQLIEKFGSNKLEIQHEFDSYLPLFKLEEDALQVIRKSADTELLQQADYDRDVIFRGFADAVKSATNHFNKEKRDAANRIEIVLNQYGNIARKPYDEETAAIYKLVQEARGKYEKDIKSLSHTDWVDELEIRNQAFDTLMKNRYSETANKNEVKMKLAREEVDASFRSICVKIDALVLVKGMNGFDAFVRELNSRVDKYKNTIAQRKGRAAKDDDESTE